MTKRWDGAIVCTTGSCNEQRQPQDFVRGVKDNSSVPISRPRTNLPDTIFWSSTVADPLFWYTTSGQITLWAGS